MGPEVVFREFASILDAEEDLAFAATMVQVRQGCTQGPTAGRVAAMLKSPCS
jgi:hypothetical protein